MGNVVIVGASRGIGLELVKQHLDAGDSVFACARDPDCAGLAALSHNAQLTTYAMDMRDDASVIAVAGQLKDIATIDLLYNVGGVIGPMEPMLEPGNWDSFDDAIEIMLKGPLRILQAMLPLMHSGSKVMNFSSQLAASAWPYGGFYAYGAAKAGLNRMMRSVAIDLKERGIIVGLIHPGYVQTDMGGAGADITPQDSAAAIIKLARWWPLEHSGDFYKWNGEKHDW